MKTTQAIEYAGSPKELADLLEITPSAVSQWGDYPPDARQLHIERITQGTLKAEPGCLERVIGLEKVRA